MSAHGRPRGRARPERRRPPPHVTGQTRAWDDYKRKTTPEQRAQIAAMLHGHDPTVGSRQLRRTMAHTQPTLLDQPHIATAYGGLTCCYCEQDVSDLAYERTYDGRMRCLRPGCHAAEERARRRAGA